MGGTPSRKRSGSRSSRSAAIQCRKTLIEKYEESFPPDSGNVKDSATGLPIELAQMFGSIDKLKRIITGDDAIHVFGDQSHGDLFIYILIDLIKNGCLTKRELSILRKSYFFTESVVVYELKKYGFDNEKLFPVDVLLDLNPVDVLLNSRKVNNRMEILNDSWTAYIFATHQQIKEKYPGAKFFIALGRSHVYAYKKRDTIIPSFPFVFENRTKLELKTYVIYTPGPEDEVVKSDDPNAVVDKSIMTELIDFPYMIIE
jgi:hypothetical protein